jgi:hypothetical protein
VRNLCVVNDTDVLSVRGFVRLSSSKLLMGFMLNLELGVDKHVVYGLRGQGVERFGVLVLTKRRY